MLRKGGEAGRTAVRHAGRTGPRDTHRKAARYSASPIGGSRPPVKAMLTLKPTPGPAPTCVDERACVTDSTDWGPDGGLTRRPVLGPRRRVSGPQGPTAERPRPHGTRGSARLAWGGCGAARSARGPAAVPVARAGGDNQGTSGRGRPPQPFPGVRPSSGQTCPRRSPCLSAGHAPRDPRARPQASPRRGRRCPGRSCRRRSGAARCRGRSGRCRRPAGSRCRGAHPDSREEPSLSTAGPPVPREGRGAGATGLSAEEGGGSALPGGGASQAQPCPRSRAPWGREKWGASSTPPAPATHFRAHVG